MYWYALTRLVHSTLQFHVSGCKKWRHSDVRCLNSRQEEKGKRWQKVAPDVDALVGVIEDTCSEAQIVKGSETVHRQTNSGSIEMAQYHR
jgi:hypothetical protein